MNNISCDVIQDLMPVYIEHMCSTESRKLVEAHMAECEGCRQVFRAYTDETIVREVSRTDVYKRQDVMLAGGTENAITPIGVGGFTALTALSTSNNPERCSIPVSYTHLDVYKRQRQI